MPLARLKTRWQRVVIVGITLALLGAGCALSTTGSQASRKQPDRDDTTMSYLALGDSYTIGEGVAATDGWPAKLARALREEGIALADPRVIATTGWTTDELAAAIDAAQPLGKFDFVTLAIGVNNQFRGRSAAQYRGEFKALLQRAIGLTGGRAQQVMVLSIPDWGVTPFAEAQGRDRAQIAREIDAFNAAVAQVSAAHGVAFVDITDISRAHGAQPAMLIDDGLHPSAAMYTLWMQRALPIARALLSSSP